MKFLYDVENSDDRRVARVYDVQDDWRHVDDGKYMVRTSMLVTRFYSTELAALKAAADFVKNGGWVTVLYAHQTQEARS